MSTQPQGAAPATMSNSQVEGAAIAFVLDHEAAAGRNAVDAHKEPGSPTDVRSTDPATGEVRLIEVKAFGRSVRGEFLMLETVQVETGEKDPDFHLYIVENVRSGDPAQFRLIDVHGAELQQLLSTKREKHYFEVPVPVGVYDRLTAPADGAALLRRVMEAVAVLHDRGYHRARFRAQWSPAGTHIRVFVAQDADIDRPDLTEGRLSAYGSFGNGNPPAAEFAGKQISLATGVEDIAAVILGAVPGLVATDDDPDYVAWFAGLLRRCRAERGFAVLGDGGSAASRWMIRREGGVGTEHMDPPPAVTS